MRKAVIIVMLKKYLKKNEKNEEESEHVNETNLALQDDKSDDGLGSISPMIGFSRY